MKYLESLIILSAILFINCNLPQTKNYPNGQVQMKFTRTLTGKAVGPYTMYYEDGNKKEEGTFQNGLMNGPYLKWYKNGQKQEVGTMKDDKVDGSYTLWYENGVKKEEGSFKAGILDGTYIQYYTNGQKSEQGTLKNGIKDGTFTKYTENGTISLNECYKDGILLPQNNIDSVVNKLTIFLLLNSAVKNSVIKKIADAGNVIGYSGLNNLLTYYFLIDNNRNIQKALFTSVLNPDNMNSVNFISNAGGGLMQCLSRNTTAKYFGEEVLWPAISRMQDIRDEFNGSLSREKNSELYTLKIGDSIGLTGYFQWWGQSEHLDKIGFLSLNSKIPQLGCVLFLEYK
jgi:hypothetical protein